MTRQALGVDEVYPYSKIIRANGFIYIKSHVGQDLETEEIVEGIEGQTRLTLDWLDLRLREAGGDIGNLVKVNIYLANIDEDFEVMDRVYCDYMDAAGIERPSARTTVGVPLSWPELLVQMDATAVE